MPTGNRRVNLDSRVWTQVTSDTASPFRIVNQNKAAITWWAGVAAPTTPQEIKDAIASAITLTVDETMSRFEEIDGLHVFMRGSSNRQDDYVVVLD